MRKLGEREKPNYELKSKVLNSELGEFYLALYKQVKVIQYNAAYHPELVSKDELKMSYRAQEVLNKSPFFREAAKINKASRSRVQRLRSRIVSFVMSGNALFVTLTFKDDVLSGTNEDSRRQYVRKYLKSQCHFYVANKDFGSQNGREHYHAVCVPLKDNKIDPALWQYGALNVERVRVSDTAPLKISKYISKITNHAIKETASSSRLIYSRDV